MSPINLILCGLPCCGKSTVGKILAKELGWECIDTDHLIEELYFHKFHVSATCREISYQNGDHFFRSLEKETITSLSNCHNKVIALGGGALLLPENRANLKTIGSLIYLKANPHMIFHNLIRRGIPSFLNPDDINGSWSQLVREREPLYLQASEFVVEVQLERNSQEVASKILRVTNLPEVHG